MSSARCWTPVAISSTSLTVAPNLIGPESFFGSITSASEITPSSSLIRPSMKLCFSRAEWYSAFSDRSPNSRARAISAELAGISTLTSWSRSARSFSRPSAVM